MPSVETTNPHQQNKILGVKYGKEELWHLDAWLSTRLPLL
jgi:hypothetical protein